MWVQELNWGPLGEQYAALLTSELSLQPCMKFYRRHLTPGGGACICRIKHLALSDYCSVYRL